MTKHSQRTDWHSGVDYRVWGDENIYPDPPNFHLSGKWQFGLCPHSELGVTRTFIWIRHYLFIAVREGNEERRVSRYPVSGLVTSPWPQLGADASLQSPDWQGWSQYCPHPLPPPPSHWLGSIFVEKTFAELRELGAGWDHQEVMGSRGVRG